MTAAPVPVAGRYRLAETLGAGGMGRVWLARDEVLDRDVAIKEIDLPDELPTGDRGAAQQRTLREARAAARLNHPNVAQVYDAFEEDGRTWIVMEYVPSRSLQGVIRADGPLEPHRVAEIGLELLAALNAAHRAGVRHRDVKPANVLLGHDGRVVLTDFGIAAIDGDGIVTSSDMVVGSPQYMAPERVRHGRTLPASDLWSLGATLFAAVEGHSPYERSSAMQILTAIAADEPDPPHRAGVLRPVLDGLLRKDPETRIDAAEAERRLWAALDGGRIPAQRRPHTGEAAEPGESPVPATADAPAAGPLVVPEASPETILEVQPEAGPQTRPGNGDGSTGRRARRRRWSVIAAFAAVLLLAAAAVSWLALRPADSPRAAPQPTPTATSAPAVAPSAGATAASTAASRSPSGSSARPAGTDRPRPALPDGWRDYRDSTGFAVYVPDGWTRSREGSIVYFRDSRSGRVLGIDQSDRPRWDPVADWRGQSAYRVRRGDFPGYQEIHIREVSYWLKAADWEFTFSGDSGRRHVNNRGFVVSKSQAYGIYWQDSDAGWKAARPDLQLVFDSFRPAAS